MVGGKQDYSACCAECFTAASVFHNPEKVLADPSYFQEHKEQLLTLTGGNQQLFCKAAAAAIITLKAGANKELRAVSCPKCGTPRVDEQGLAMHSHFIHVC